MAGTLGCTIDAPAAAAYAVLPVGVEMMRPTCKTSKSLNKYSKKFETRKVHNTNHLLGPT